MNCKLCQKELDAYHEGKLAEGIRVQVDAHLESCKRCAESYQMLFLADKIMNEEKSFLSNPFLSTRVMAGIGALEQKQEGYLRIPVYQKMIKPALIGISIAAAIFIGVVTGNIYKPTHSANEVPVEMAYINDAALESVNMFSNE